MRGRRFRARRPGYPALVMGVMIRCGNCGEMRWSILGGDDRPHDGVCDRCGLPFSLERRRPARFVVEPGGEAVHPSAIEERRDLPAAPGPPV